MWLIVPDELKRVGQQYFGPKLRHVCAKFNFLARLTFSAESSSCYTYTVTSHPSYWLINHRWRSAAVADDVESTCTAAQPSKCPARAPEQSFIADSARIHSVLSAFDLLSLDNDKWASNKNSQPFALPRRDWDNVYSVHQWIVKIFFQLYFV